MINRDAIVDQARIYLGTPFAHGGRLSGVGIDCVGLIICVARDLGIPLADRQAYPLSPDGTMHQEIAAQMPVSLNGPERGDILLLAIDHVAHHVAIYTGYTIIHAHVRARGCIEQPYDSYWHSITHGVFKFPGVVD